MKKPYKYKQPRTAVAYDAPVRAPLKDVSLTQKGRAMIAGAPTPNCKIYESGKMLVIASPPDEAVGNGWMLSIMHESRPPSFADIMAICAALIPVGTHMAVSLPDIGAQQDDRVVIVAELPSPEFIISLSAQRKLVVQTLIDKHAEATAQAQARANLAHAMRPAQRVAQNAEAEYSRGYAAALRDAFEFVADTFGLTLATQGDDAAQAEETSEVKS